MESVVAESGTRIEGDVTPGEVPRASVGFVGGELSRSIDLLDCRGGLIYERGGRVVESMLADDVEVGEEFSSDVRLDTGDEVEVVR